MFEPAAGMTSCGVVMCPVNNTALFVPFVFTVKADPIAGAQSVDARCKIDIVRNQDGLSGLKFKHETLVAVALIVV